MSNPTNKQSKRCKANWSTSGKHKTKSTEFCRNAKSLFFFSVSRNHFKQNNVMRVIAFAKASAEYEEFVVSSKQEASSNLDALKSLADKEVARLRRMLIEKKRHEALLRSFPDTVTTVVGGLSYKCNFETNYCVFLIRDLRFHPRKTDTHATRAGYGNSECIRRGELVAATKAGGIQGIAAEGFELD